MENRLMMNAFVLLAFVVFVQGQTDLKKESSSTTQVPVNVSSSSTPKPLDTTTVVISTDLPNNTVEMEVFYEVTSTESALFFNSSFKSAYEKLKKSITVTFNPFTSENSSAVHLKVIQCKENDTECKADRVHACGIENIADKDKLLEFIICALNQKTQHANNNSTSIIEKCSSSLDLTTTKSIENCTVEYSKWYTLLDRYYNKATHINVTKIPTVLINKKKEDNSNNILKDLCKVIPNHNTLEACKSGSPKTVVVGILPLLIGVYYFIKIF